MSDTKHLIQRRGIWLFNWRVPSDCKDAFDGKTYLTKSLQTQSLREAQHRRNIALAECSKVVEEVRSAHAGDPKALFRLHLENMKKTDHEDLAAAWSAVEDKTPTDPFDISFKEALKVEYLGHVSELVKCSLKDTLKAYLEDRGNARSRSTVLKVNRAVKVFLEYIGKDDITIEAVTRKTVKSFIKDTGKHRKSATVKGIISMLSTCVKVAMDDGLIPDDYPNPFERHTIKGGDQESYDMFPPNKLKAIFELTEKYKNHPKLYHRYYMPRLGYTTSCRIEELASLQRAQVLEENGILYFWIAHKDRATYKGKTVNAMRKIPIHSTLVEDIRALRDSGSSDLLFPILESKRRDGKCGDKYSKQFGEFKRKELGISERKQSFHSFRVHLSTGFERADVPENRAVWIMGHTRNLSLSYGLYSKGPSLEQLKADIEKAVVWP
ncbi:hypothetical protein R50072_13560 [Simiduia litorea]|uniref:DUF6538 domain-containing protein n=1 Tax=Simiduia litorea TaxID=1435348 RepID=UPI0036F37A50